MIVMQQQDINFENFTLVPSDYKRKDPRQMAYNFADTIRNTEKGLVIYNRYVQQFIYYHSLDTAEQVAKAFNYILVPSSCIHWRRAKHFKDRRIMVGREAFYTVTPSELNKNELKKLKEYMEGKEE